MATNRVSPFSPPDHLVGSYLQALLELFQNELTRIGRRAMTPEAIVDLLRTQAARPLFLRSAEELAARMVAGVQVRNARSWRQAAAQSIQGRRIHDLLKQELARGPGERVDAIVRENARLIRTLPLHLAEQATAYTAKRQIEGQRAGEIAAQLREIMPRYAAGRIKLIARTEVGKAESAVTQTRATDLGLRWYLWRTSEDQRVRPSHRLMDGVLVAWDSPPSPEQLAREKSVGHYQAGCIYNCRCISLPLVDVPSVSWPRRVHIAGSLRRMTRREFEVYTQTSAAA